ncbi:hypothetical protein AB9F26_09495 [Falsihalocynthiibacter sp. BN13B15]|uniref:hypothetical protein n=1 Tax=Falsihalocynthiibacter sp. BN13B15 TaxID=3240871 RepID=UPI003510BA24
MNTTTVQYPGYTIEIPDGLIQPFRELSTIINNIYVDGPDGILSNPVTRKLVEHCNDCVSAAIGKEFAHELKIGDALSQWRNLSSYERSSLILDAAFNTEPFNISSVFEAGSSPDEN